MATVPEVTMVCLDNSSSLYGHRYSKAQIEAVRVYCEVKFKCNPKNLVGIFGMSSSELGPKLSPTNDLSSIVSFLEDIFRYDYGDRADFFYSMGDALSVLWGFRYMEKRILVFVGSPIDLHWSKTEPLGKELKENYMALDVVNFLLLGKERHLVEVGSDEFDMLYGKYHYGREQLGELVTLVNTNDNSHIVDMADVDENTVGRRLQRSRILRKNMRHCLKKDKNKIKKNGNVEVKKSSEGI